jgi:hypothetical protein
VLVGGCCYGEDGCAEMYVVMDCAVFTLIFAVSIG